MSQALHTLLQNPRLWRGDQYAKVVLESIPTGFHELDAQLPGGGWPRGALTELLSRQTGIGELRLLIPALAALSRQEKWLMLIAPPHVPYAPGFTSLGVDLSHLVVVRTRSGGESLWAAERCLRCGSCAAVLVWPGAVTDKGLRRLQLAAEEGKSWGVIFGSLRNAAAASPAALRIQLNAYRESLEVQIIKRRGGGWALPLHLDVGRAETGFVLHPTSPETGTDLMNSIDLRPRTPTDWRSAIPAAAAMIRSASTDQGANRSAAAS